MAVNVGTYTIAWLAIPQHPSHEHYTIVAWLMLIGCELLGLILANVLGIMIGHGKGTYQATRIVRWDIRKVVPQFVS